ncbi:MAG: hypothetical protein COZ06_13065 [Armatimonadetes bacterium CG_4_10_14_3_um_filter_66_18]|nr:hypothetical protein [Armatimonadota bacterium]PIU91706.1 MAG: hypothetical protein COS65_21125 [Armatimonadetes bacterium CG06_land_8_20_14_3_00_66_21]PIY49725.1 MAG: hypothetical protein COZ06_13065 [Armatimonadetes bacterium CG_4_10_14_3_um_filter_66_18]PJB62456.1 MAG: hypothetical protein CO096_25480 [Armatimonadetes bacterium CG_4_9_14_3_um_filter_66_14]
MKHLLAVFSEVVPVLAAALWTAGCAFPQDGGTPMQVNVPLDITGWQEQLQEVRPAELPKLLKVHDWPERQPQGPAYAVSGEPDNLLFAIADQRSPALRTMVWTRSLPPANLSGWGFFLLTYRACGVARSHAPLNAVAVVGKGVDGKELTTPLLPVAEVLNDDRWHRVLGKVALPASGTLRVQLGTRDDKGRLQLGALKLLGAPPSLEFGEACAAKDAPARPVPAKAKWECLDLSSQFNDTCAAAFDRLLAKQGTVIDGASVLTSGLVRGIPFKVGGAPANLIRPVESNGDEKPVEFLGVKTTRHFVRPPGRDDVVAVDLGGKASEVVFLMVSAVPKGGPHYAEAPGPHNFNDIGALAVELQYDSGEPDIAFPYSLADRGFTATRMAGVYVAAADPGRTLRRFVLHNRLSGSNYSLAALTLNVGTGRLVPELVADPPPVRVQKAPTPKPQQAHLRQEGQLLKLGNSACDMVVDCSRGFAIKELVNRYAPKQRGLAAGSGLEVYVGDELLTGRAFATKRLGINGTEATIALESTVAGVPLGLEVRVAVDDKPEVRLRLSARNLGPQEITPVIRFPLLRSVECGRLADNVLFFPQYRTVASQKSAFYQLVNDRSFPMQFMDVSNPVVGIGLGLLTRDTDLTPLEYGIGKDTTAQMFVQSSEPFSKLSPGQVLTMPETVLLPHAGDWHATMDAYRQWLTRVGADGAPAPDRDWFRRLFAMRVHLTKKAYSWAIPIYDPATKQYRIDDFMKADTDYLRVAPELVHLGGWCDFDQEQGGDFLGGDYAVKDYTGGVDNLRAAIRSLQEEHHIPVSLYMIPDRCRKTSEIGTKLGRRICTVRQDGSVGEDGPLYYVCPAYSEWQDHYVEAVKRTQRELGVKALYIDVFAFSHGAACYSTEHGHPVPSNPKQVNRELIRRLREALPPEVALWSEYPLDDMNARYIAGNIHYYCLDWHEYFSETHNAAEAAPQVASTALNAYRYAFPHTRQFIFLCGSKSWSSECKFPFFNGEPLYDVSWFLYAGSNLVLVRNALALQQKYADCFASANPRMEVLTEKWEVHSNEFPGAGRTAWTLYNARYTTVSGPVLRVPHAAGATYVDAWNGRRLKPALAGKTATISLRMEPQSLGCVVQERKP